MNRKVGWWESLNQADRRADTITSLGNSQEFGLVRWLAPFALSSNDGIRHASRKALDYLLKLVPIGQLIAFDAFARQGGPIWSPRSSWQTLDAASVEEFGRDEGIGVLSFTSMHSNGRVREAALRDLAARYGGQELPFLLLRTNDWVKPVREYAQACVLARLNSKYAGAFLSCLPLVLRLELCARAQHEELVTSIGRLLASDGCRPVLEEGLRSEDRQIRLACLRFTHSFGGTASREILLAALGDENPLIRFYVVHQVLGAVEGEERNRILQKLRQDAFMPIRREALRAHVLSGDEGLLNTLCVALLDRHRSIREFARFHLNDRIDIPQFYRDAIDARRRGLAAAIRGLAATLIAVLAAHGSAHFVDSPSLTLLFQGGGIVTAFPLIWFISAAKLLPLSTLGFFQYLAPTLQLMVGVFLFHERFTHRDAIAFALIWTAIAIFLASSGGR